MHTIKQGFAWIEWNGINAAINVYPTNDYFLQSLSDWWKLDIHVSFHYLSIDTLCAFVVLPFFWIYFVLSAFSDNCADIECTGIKWLNQSSYIVHTQTKILKVWSLHSFDEFFATLDFFKFIMSWYLHVLCIWMYCYLRATTQEVPLNYRTPQHFKKKPGCSLLGEPKLNNCWCFASQVTFKCQRPLKKITLLFFFYARKRYLRSCSFAYRQRWRNLRVVVC